MMNEPVKYASRAEWLAEGERRFGPDLMTWKFVCPSCGFVQTAADFKAAGAEDTSMVGFSCIGRLTGGREAFRKGPGPCNYAGGGLFRIAPVQIAEIPDSYYFDFAPGAEAGAR